MTWRRNLIWVLVLCHFVPLRVVAEKTTLTDTTYINQLLEVAWQMQNTLPDSSMKLAREAYVFSEGHGYTRGVSDAFMRIGSLHTLYGNYDSAKYYLLACYRMRKAARHMEGLSSTAISLSYVYGYLGKTDSVFFYLYECLRYTKQSGNASDLIVTNLELGHALTRYGDTRQALGYYLEAEKIAKQLNNTEKLIGVYSGLGNYYFNLALYRKALSYFALSNNLLEKSTDVYARGKTHNNIALCYEQLHNYSEALNEYRQALYFYQKLGSKSDIALTYFNLSSLFINRNVPDSALKYLDRALAIAVELGDVQRIADCYDYTAEAFVLKKNYKKAYDFHVKSAVLRDSLMNAEKIRSISEMQTKYETDLKNKEIEVLQQQGELANIKASRSLGINIGLSSALLGILFVTYAFYTQSKKKEKLNIALQSEKQKSDNLLLNILPEEIASELKQNGKTEAKLFQHVSVLFTDFVNFTGLSEEMTPTELVAEIHHNFTAFDAIMEKHGMEKIKTIGDAYLAVCGLPNETPDHAQRTVRAALDIQAFMQQSNGKFQIRIGIHTGAVVAGIVGVKKYAYDIWGDTVNTAARMEQHSDAGKINISEATHELIKDEFTCEYRGKVNAKNKGEIDMWFVLKSS